MMNPNDLAALIEEVSDFARDASEKKGVVFITDTPEKINPVIDIDINIERESLERLVTDFLTDIINHSEEGFIKFTMKSYLVYRNCRLARDLFFTVEDSLFVETHIDIGEHERLCRELGGVMSVTYDEMKGHTYKLSFTSEKEADDLADRLKSPGIGASDSDSPAKFEDIIDIERLRKRLGISMESVFSILEAFYKSMPSRIKEAEDFVETDIDKYRIIVHGLKGALGNIGIEDLRRMAILLERAAENKDISYIREYNPLFVSEMNSIYKKIEVFLATKPKTVEEISYQIDGGDDILKEMLSEVTVYIKHLENLDAIDMLNNILSKKICREPEKIIRVISALDIYDYNQAYDMVIDLLKNN